MKVCSAIWGIGLDLGNKIKEKSVLLFIKRTLKYRAGSGPIENTTITFLKYLPF
jgi:hypothetical protein